MAVPLCSAKATFHSALWHPVTSALSGYLKFPGHCVSLCSTVRLFRVFRVAICSLCLSVYRKGREGEDERKGGVMKGEVAWEREEGKRSVGRGAGKEGGWGERGRGSQAEGGQAGVGGASPSHASVCGREGVPSSAAGRNDAAWRNSPAVLRAVLPHAEGGWQLSGHRLVSFRGHLCPATLPPLLSSAVACK